MLQTPKCYERRCRQFAGVAQPDGDESSEKPICRAFPNGIPAEISYGDELHLNPYKGDNGIVYEKASADHDMNAGPELKEGEEWIRAEPDEEEEDEEGEKSIEVRSAIRKAIEESRIKQYEEIAESLEGVLDDYFAGSVERIVSGLGSDWTPDPEHVEAQAAKLLDENFDADLESTKLMEAAAAPLLAAFGKAVAQQREETKNIKRTKPHRTKKTRRKPTTAEQFVGKYDLDVPELSDIVDEFHISLRMPDWMVEQAFETLDETFKRDYWREGIAPSTRRDVERTLKAAIEEGLNSRDIANRLVEQHGRRYTQARATAVARTELGSMLNSGHSAGIEELAEDTGIEIRKEWLSALGSTTRLSHAALHGTLANDDGMFDLDGVLIPYPSHPDLPAENRINCLCTVISSIL